MAQGESKLNLAVAADEGRMYLQQEGAQLRSMRVHLGPEYQPARDDRTILSHGCIRLRNEDIARLHEMVAVGTPVYIY